MSLEDHLESLGLPKEYTFKVAEEPPVTIDYVNKEFLIFNKEDYIRLKEKFRMLAESINNGEGTCNAPPYILLPEQVAILSLYGHARVRKMKDDPNLFDKTAFIPSTSNKTIQNVEEETEKARKIAIGRKAKQLKRKITNGEGVTAKKLKVKKEDLDGIEVTEEEVAEVLNEISSKEENPLTNLLLQYERKDFYEFIDHFSLSLPNNLEFRRRELVVHDLWRRGFYITAGLRFGCHYLAYEGIPGEVHSRFLVECLDAEETLSPMKMITLTRVATQVKKTVLLAIVDSSSNIPHYMTLSWFKPYE